MTNEKKDIILRTLDLGENILDGLEHTLNLVKQGEYQETVTLIADILEGFSTMERSIVVVWTEESADLTGLTDKLRSSFDLLVNAYEESDAIKVPDTLRDEVLPSYKKWFEFVKNNLASI